MNIHIGMNKTGSTSLQRFLFSNREVLRAQGSKYFDNDEFMFRNAHHRVPNSFLPDLGWLSLDASADERNTPEIIASVLRDELDKNRLRNVVLSSELFSIFGTNAGKAARWLNGINRGCQVRIIVYIRNYPDFMESRLAHRITFGGFDREKVTEEFKRNFCLGINGHYGRVIDSYARHFGRENMEVRVLEKVQLHGGDIISDFLALLGLEKDGSYRNAGLKNVSLGRNGLEYMMLLNRMHKESPVDSLNFRIIMRALKQLPDRETCSLFNSGLRSDIVNWCKEECSYIAREYLGRKDGVLFTEPLGKDNPGGESYRGLDPEYSVNVSLAIIDMAVGQGAFSGLKRGEGTHLGKRITPGRSLKNLCLRVPGSRMLLDLIKRWS